jgi:coronin-1B/1C/6
MAKLTKEKKQVHENEVARAFKTVNDAYIEPISFIVPRRAEVFQTDIYPPTIGLKAAMSAADWFGGKTAVPPQVSLRGKYEGGEVDEVEDARDVTPASMAVKAEPAPTAAKVEAKAPEPAVPSVATATATAAAAAPKGELKDNKQAMSDMANRFADNPDDAASSSGDSSFEEVSRPIERPPRVIITTARATSTSPVKPSTATSTSATKVTARSTPATTPIPAQSDELSAKLGDICASQADTAVEVAGLRRQVNELTELVRQLTGRLDGLAGGQAERIRRVELELEGLRD